MRCVLSSALRPASLSLSPPLTHQPPPPTPPPTPTHTELLAAFSSTTDPTSLHTAIDHLITAGHVTRVGSTLQLRNRAALNRRPPASRINIRSISSEVFRMVVEEGGTGGGGGGKERVLETIEADKAFYQVRCFDLRQVLRAGCFALVLICFVLSGPGVAWGFGCVRGGGGCSVRLQTRTEYYCESALIHYTIHPTPPQKNKNQNNSCTTAPSTCIRGRATLSPTSTSPPVPPLCDGRRPRTTRR
jgi:hypothetical protein